MKTKTAKVPRKSGFQKGNNASNGKGGRRCEFCKEPEKILNKIKLYSEWTLGRVDKEVHTPFLEELCDEDYLDIHMDTIHDWTHGKHAEANHVDLIRTIKKLVMRQKRFLLKHTLTSQQVSGAIFQLKANHGMIETEKKILAGSGTEPLEIIITEEDRKKDGE